MTILQGDVRETLKTLPSDSVHCVVTSPPYWALRSYLAKDHALKPLEIGSESTPEAYIATMVEVFREVRRVLHPSGTCWVNIGDSYSQGGGPAGSEKQASNRGANDTSRSAADSGIPSKNLCLIPERFALAMQSDGWWVRSRIAWCKRSPMPESVTDRPTSAWEHVWLLTKSARYFYDATAVRQPQTGNAHSRGKGICPKTQKNGGDIKANESFHSSTSQWTESKDSCANLRNFWQLDDHTALVRWLAQHHPDALKEYAKESQRLTDSWLLGPEPYSEAHFATFPSEIPKRAILAGSSARGCCPKCLAPWERTVEKAKVENPGHKWGARGSAKIDPANRSGACFDTTHLTETRTTGWQPTCTCDSGDPIPCTVLDPFAGTGCTLMVAIELGRRAIGCELNPAYIAMIRDRTNVTPGLQLA